MYFWEHFRISACWLGFSLAHWDERLKNQRSCGGPSRSSMSTSHTVWTFGPGLVVAKVIIVLVFDWSVKWLEWLNSLSRSRSVIADGEMEHKIRLHEASVSRRTNEKPGPAQGLNLSSTRNIREPQTAFCETFHRNAVLGCTSNVRVDIVMNCHTWMMHSVIAVFSRDALIWNFRTDNR